MEQLTKLETKLNDFDREVRTGALEELMTLVESGAVELKPDVGVANMHLHTFFSFNAYGHSPTSLAWLAKKRGVGLAGIVDFDVLDGVDEFLHACELLGLRGGAGIETRVFIPEYADREINSLGEPGVCYHMGIGFATGQVPGAVAPILADLGRRADQRNQEIMARVNDYLDLVNIEYQRDVLPLTPAGHPTERHMVVACVHGVERTIADLVAFWADKLDIAPGEMAAIMSDSPNFQNLIRARLMKQGGVGYVQPESGMFPSLEDFHKLIVACGALPCAAWLDGTTAVERNPEEWLGFLVKKGVVALNIIPDRNWNIADPGIKQLKLQNLYRIVEVARDLDLSLNIGTEMNSFGQKAVDDFDVPELAPIRQAFLDGAYMSYGHTTMQRALGLGYQSDWASSHLPTRHQRYEFYVRIGCLVSPGLESLKKLRQLDPALSPDEILSHWR